MSLYRRPNSPYWWCKFHVRGVEIRRSTQCTDRRKAEAAEADLRERLKDRAAGVGHTWQEAAERWLDEHATKRSLAKDAEILKWLQTRPEIAGRRLDEITRDDIESVRQAKRRTASAATTNRYMALVRAILRAAVEDWEWLRRAPKVPMFRLEQPEPRWITRAEFDELMKHLPAHTRQLARFAVATGLRRTNITALRWRDVDLKARHVTIPGRAAKGKRGIPVPLNADAMAVLREQRGHPVWVFTYNGQPIEQVATKAWRAACRKAGLPGLRFHDLRHTWASWHVQSGTPLVELQALGGWRSYQMVLRYAHLSSASLRAAAARIEGTQKGTRSKAGAGK